MRTEIYIENQRLDLTEDVNTDFTYAIDDINDFGAKNTNYSKTIRIAGNANNNAIFGNIFDLNNANWSSPPDGSPRRIQTNSEEAELSPSAQAVIKTLLTKQQV